MIQFLPLKMINMETYEVTKDISDFNTMQWAIYDYVQIYHQQVYQMY